MGAQNNFSPSEIFRDRGVFLMGGTGFLGKVTLAMLLHNFPHVRRVYVMVRAGSGTSSEDRFWSDVVGSPVFDPLRERYGGTLEGFVRDKVRVVGGDITLLHLGYDEAQAQAIAGDIDVIVNSSGKVTFNPALDQSLRTNVDGTRNVVAFAKRMRRPTLVHVSTCFVAGNRCGEVWENEPVVGYFPRRHELEGATFSVEQEVADCHRLAQRVREEAQDAVQAAHFLKAARDRLREEGRDPDNQRYLKLAQARERKNWIRDRLTQQGIERAQRWGWPNIYCYTKAMGDQLVAREAEMVRTIVRPSIVESAVRFPFPGWNEGFTTTAPLTFLALKGQNLFLTSDKLILDVTPVDSIAGGLLAAAAQACVEQPPLVFQLASGDTNPIRMRRVITLLGLHKRRHLQKQGEGAQRLLNQALARMEAQPVSVDRFEHASVPMFNKMARQTSTLLSRIRPRWGAARVADIIDHVKEHVDRVEEVTRGVEQAFEMYRPFTVENAYIFRTDSIRTLQERMVPAERSLLPWEVAGIDWYHYWLDIHFPGLEKWVFPQLEKDFAAKPKAVYTYNHLLELMETAARLHPTRVAMRMSREGHDDRYTYAELQELATRVAVFFDQRGVATGQRVMLLSENRPEWGMAYFGVIKAGATCVPVDKESSTAEIVNLARSGEVNGIVISEQMQQEHPQLVSQLQDAGLDVAVWPFEQVFALPPENEEQRAVAQLKPRIKSDAVASLIFTSGTTGQPKGVMLTHRNFTYMTSELKSVFDLGPRDGLLSVLPLHHTFEFSAGLLAPLAHGAQITYLSELTGDAINRALKRGHTTAIVGVPALWELLTRRMKTTVTDVAPWLADVIEQLARAHNWLRRKTALNFGPLLFWPFHRRLGGRIRYLISGGSALAEDVKRYIQGLGLNLLEGYGLTEASPVITVARPDRNVPLSSVGQPLPHVELRILDADERGVGEVIARGPTIMAGYYGDQRATDATLRDGWLHTGDLGHLDKDRNLYLVGRSKDVIVDANGKNVYPDELEEVYGGCEWVKELSVVGLPDGTAERVAALFVPDYERETSLSRDDVRAKVREHVRAVSATLPFFKRIRILQFSDGELPRTATRKVKRREVIDQIKRLQQGVGKGESTQQPAGKSDNEWLYEVVANVSGKPRSRVELDTRLDQLGFDSLMYTELAVALEAAGASLVGTDDVMAIGDMRELVASVRRGAPSATAHGATAHGTTSHGTTSHWAASSVVEGSRALLRVGAGGPAQDDEMQEIPVPSLVAELGTKVLGRGQRWLYDNLLDCSFEGRAHIPRHTNFIVASNHCSHLDTGLIKMALEDAGDNLCALAATDYFFDTPLKRAYFENFTNLVPMDRSGSLKRSLRQALDLLRQGHSLLIFPEGTRSMTGRIESFKASLGYLAMHGRVGILPIHVQGTLEALPKGTALLKSRRVGANIGRLVTCEQLQLLTAGLPRSDGYRLVSSAVQHVVEAMRDGEPGILDIEQERARWNEQRQNDPVPAEQEHRQREQPSAREERR